VIDFLIARGDSRLGMMWRGFIGLSWRFSIVYDEGVLLFGTSLRGKYPVWSSRVSNLNVFFLTLVSIFDHVLDIRRRIRM
jgi:hypothetical protein